jgi:HEAT repeat protein
MNAVPQIVDLLKDNDPAVRSAGTSMITKLAEKCK